MTGDGVTRLKVTARQSEEECMSLACSLCKGEIGLEAGDVIYGDQWYHSNCWHEMDEAILEKRGPE